MRDAPDAFRPAQQRHAEAQALLSREKTSGEDAPVTQQDARKGGSLPRIRDASGPDHRGQAELCTTAVMLLAGRGTCGWPARTTR